MLFENKLKEIYRSMLFPRQDNAHGIFYFSAEDFPGLQVHPYSFSSSAGHVLNGFFYHYDAPRADRLLVFDHGLGNGHRAYFREIETLCRAGWLVFTYDHTGCMTSGGEDIRGFAQSLTDLDDCFRALKAEPTLQGRSFSVMGHSWGGFSTMNIAALHPEITHVVSMSGFISPERMIRQFLPGLMGAYVPAIFKIELENNPKYARTSALESLRKTNAKVLLIYSEDDKTVHKKDHFDPLLHALSGRKNIEFLLVNGKDHNPHYTADAVQYKNDFWKTTEKAIKQKKLETPEQQQAFMANYDWYRMTTQDEDVWEKILTHFEK